MGGTEGGEGGGSAVIKHYSRGRLISLFASIASYFPRSLYSALRLPSLPPSLPPSPGTYQTHRVFQGHAVLKCKDGEFREGGIDDLRGGGGEGEEGGDGSE